MLQVAKLYSAMALGCDGFYITLKSTAGRDTKLLASSVISANTDSEMEQASKHASTPPSSLNSYSIFNSRSIGVYSLHMSEFPHTICVHHSWMPRDSRHRLLLPISRSLPCFTPHTKAKNSHPVSGKIAPVALMEGNADRKKFTTALRRVQERVQWLPGFFPVLPYFLLLRTVKL